MYVMLSDGLLPFVTYEWVTNFLELRRENQLYVISSVGKLPLEINSSFDLSENFIVDKGHPKAHGFIRLFKVQGRTSG
jgi:hypothetical protein